MRVTPAADPKELSTDLPRTDNEFLDLARRRYTLGLDYDRIDRDSAEADELEFTLLGR